MPVRNRLGGSLALLGATAAWHPGVDALAPRRAIVGSSSNLHPLATMSTNSVGQTTARPYPRIGDIVAFPGKWKGEEGVGRLATLQYIKQRREWIGDVVVLNDIEPGAKKITFDAVVPPFPCIVGMLLMLVLVITRKAYTEKNAGEGIRSACRSLN